jgi:hypothetical protein
MGRPTKAEQLADIHALALRQFGDIWSVAREERAMCLEDRRFASVAGAQWEGDLGLQFENRPRLEVNKVHLSVIRIISEYRNNRVTVDFISKDGVEADELADLCDGLYRADEQDSAADEAYDNAFEEAVTGGYGAWRLRAVYEDETDPENERQRIRIEPIHDADTTVFFDANARRQDKSDARYCFVLAPMTLEAYRETYNDNPAGWPKERFATEFDWHDGDTVYVAEYYRIEDRPDTILTFRTIDGQEEKHVASELSPDTADEMAALGSVLIGQRKIKRPRVRKLVMSGGGILEDQGYLAGPHIPIVPVYGKRSVINGQERCLGHVRLSKDAQRLKNMQLSRLAEISALSPIEKPIFTPDQVAGHEIDWQEDNVRNYPFLRVNPIIGPNGEEIPQGPVGYTKPPAIPPAMAALLQITETDIQELLGSQQAGEELQPNMSGKAVELVQNRLDMQTAIYLSNFAKGMRRCGEIWLGMAREIYVEEGRRMKSIAPQGAAESVILNTPDIDAKTGATVMANDLTRAKLDVAVDVGPSSASRRSATVRALTGMMQFTQDPQTMQVLSATAMMNIEGEGLKDIREWFRRKLLEIGAVQPTDEEAEEMQAAAQNMPPDPNAQYLAAAADEAQAKAIKAQADTEYALARAQETKAKTLATLAGIDQGDQRAAIDTAKAIQGFVQQPQPSGGNGRV